MTFPLSLLLFSVRLDLGQILGNIGANNGQNKPNPNDPLGSLIGGILNNAELQVGLNEKGEVQFGINQKPGQGQNGGGGQIGGGQFNPGGGGSVNPGDGNFNPGGGSFNPGGGSFNPGGGSFNPGRCKDRGVEYFGTNLDIRNNGPRNKVRE